MRRKGKLGIIGTLIIAVAIILIVMAIFMSKFPTAFRGIVNIMLSSIGLNPQP